MRLRDRLLMANNGGAAAAAAPPIGTLLGWWKGNSSPGQVADSSGNNRSLSIVGVTPNNASSPTPPEGDRWLTYHSTLGANSYCYFIPATAVPVATAKGRIEFDFVADVAHNGSTGVMFDLRANANIFANSMYAYYIAGNKLEVVCAKDGGTLCSAQVSLTLGSTVHHLICDYGTDGCKFYLDGTLIASTDSNASQASYSGYEYIGGSQYAYSTYWGGIDNFKIWQRF